MAEEKQPFFDGNDFGVRLAKAMLCRGDLCYILMLKA
jgi:hypothetical protein